MINQPSLYNNINFLGYKTNFSKQLEKFNAEPCPTPEEMIELKKSMSQIADKKMKPKYKMGEGKFHEVYRIDDYYVMRIPKEDRNPHVGLPRKPRKGISEYYANFKTYVGHVISEFGDYEIIKNAKGEHKDVVQAGASYKLVQNIAKCKTFEEIDNIQNLINIEYNEKYLPAFSSLPQKAYDNVAADIKRLNDTSYLTTKLFDCNNPNNFIKVGQRIKIIDDISYSDKAGDVSDMMRVFLRNYDAPDTPETIKMKKTIFKKCIIAAAKNDIIDDLHKLGKHMEFAGIKEEPDVFAQKILEYSQLPKNKKIKELNKYLNTL